MQGTGAIHLIDALVAAGVRNLFSLSGNQIMSVYDATIGRDIEVIHTRHEAAAVHMADGWGRLTGEPGVALLTAGPGHLNAISALYVALMAESPLLMISGHAPVSQLGRGAFQEVDQVGVAAPVTKAAWRVDAADEVGSAVARAIRLARSSRPGPVHLSLPDDVLKEAAAAAPAAEDGGGPSVEGDEVWQALGLLAAGERPLILAGPAFMRPERRAQVGALAVATGCPALLMESPRGVNDPALHEAVNCLKEADVVLLLGRKLDFGLRFGVPPFFAAGCRFVQVEPDPAELRDADAVALRIQADPVQVMQQMTEAGGDGVENEAWRARVEAALAAEPEAWAGLRRSAARPIHPLRICAAVQPYLDDGATFVSDGGEFGQWAQAGLVAGRRIINGTAGSIGSSLPMGLAAALRFPENPVFVFQGDGTFGFHCMELDTAVRYGIPVVVIVGNDARWNAEHQIQLNSYGEERTIACDLLPSRYDQVAQALGAHGERVEDPAELEGAIERAVAAGKPACVDVLIEPAAAPSLLVGGSHP